MGVGAIVVCNGRILLEKRKKEPGKGKWSVPGGIVELGESPEQAVVREVEEKTRLKVGTPVLIDVVNSLTIDASDRIKYDFIIIDYFVTVESGNAAAASDAEELKWVPLREVFDYTLTKSIMEFFQRNMEKLLKLNSCP